MVEERGSSRDSGSKQANSNETKDTGEVLLLTKEEFTKLK